MKRWDHFDKVYRIYVINVVGSPDDFKTFLLDEIGYTDSIDDLNADDSTGYCIETNPDNNDRGNTCFVIWLKDFTLPTLIHELTHLTMFVLDDKAVPMRRENTEALAYYLEHWFIEITRIWRKHPRGRAHKELDYHG